jgi:hypothetical protein
VHAGEQESHPWSPGASEGDVVGLLLDSDAGSLHVFLNGRVSDLPCTQWKHEHAAVLIDLFLCVAAAGNCQPGAMSR